jgi:prolyl-tRNA editing enzyme YbaK/EbsC (Cys-tRNA(Pro) deacylase)
MIPDKVRKFLDSHNLSAFEFEAGSAQSSDNAARQLGVAVGQVARSTLLKSGAGRLYLVIGPGDRHICSEKIQRTIGSKVRMAREDEVGISTGFKPGGICPFGIRGVDILIDWSLARYETLYPAAGVNGSVVPMSFAQLQTITGGRVVDVMLEADKH